MPPFRRWNRFPGRFSPYRWRGPVYNRVVEYPVAYPVEYPVYVPVSTPEKNTAQNAISQNDDKPDNNKIYMGIFALLFIFVVIMAMRR